MDQFGKNLNFQIDKVKSVNSANICVLDAKNVGKARPCTKVENWSKETVDMHPNYKSITLFDKFLMLLGIYDLRPQTVDGSLRKIDFVGNFNKNI